MDDEVVAESRGGESWHIRRDGNQLTFRGVDGAHFEISLHETAGRIEWQGLICDQPHLVVFVPKRRVFRLEQTDAFTLLQWLGPPGPEHLKAALSTRFRGTLIAGLLWVVMSLVPNETVASLTVALLGSVLVFEAVLIRVKPVPALFLLDAAWCACVAVRAMYGAFVRFELIGFVFVPWLCMLAWFDVQQHSYFQSVTTEAVTDRLV